MNWAEDVIANLERSSPDAVHLAEAVSPAIRIEPELLRAMRLELLPETDAGCEADLWFSDLVDERSPVGIVLDADVAELLRRRLASVKERLTRATAVITEAHREVPAAVQLEEELTYLSLRGDTDTVRDRLRSAVASLVDPERPGLAAWAARSLERLPDPVRDLDEAQMLAAGARLRVGEDAAPSIDVPPERLMKWIDWLAPRTAETLPVGVALVAGGVEIGAIRGDYVHLVEVPAFRPILLEVSWREDGDQRSETVRLRPNGVVFVDGPADWVDLRTARGDCYRLWDQAPEGVTRSPLPRVQIEYDVELEGAVTRIQLPFVMGVMADLSGSPAEPLPPIGERRFLEIDVDNFDDRVKALKPRVAFHVPNMLTGEGELSVDLTFESMDDFSPAAVARGVDALSTLLDIRTELVNLLTYMDRGEREAGELIDRLIQDETLLRSLASAPTSDQNLETKPKAKTKAPPFTADEFSGLLTKAFKPLSDRQREAVETAVRTLAEQLLADKSITPTNALGTIQTLITRIDEKLTNQLNPIFHHEDFQKLEGAWRGLHYLVNNTETNEMLKIKLLNISKKDLHNTLKSFEGNNWGQSPIFKKIYEESYGIFGGEPYGCLIGDFYFDHSQQDVLILKEMAQIGAAAHCPFLAGVSPTVMQMESWQELDRPRDLAKIFDISEYAAWRSLRDAEDSRYLGLCMPRVLSRHPYGAKTHPVEEFDFGEDTEGAYHDKYCWSNSAYAMAANINRAFKRYGWCARIRGVESGGAVEGLPVHAFPTDDGGVDMKCPTEIGISDRREAELANVGFMPLVHRRGTDFAAFIDAQSLQKPHVYDDDDATANTKLAARLPYLFAACRFAQYLKCIVRDKIGSFMEREDMELFLNRWIRNYVTDDPMTAPEPLKAIHPLAQAEVLVQDVEGNPGHYSGVFYLRPFYQLEGLTVSLRIVSTLPSAR